MRMYVYVHVKYVYGRSPFIVDLVPTLCLPGGWGTRSGGTRSGGTRSGAQGSSLPLTGEAYA